MEKPQLHMSQRSVFALPGFFGLVSNQCNVIESIQHNMTFIWVLPPSLSLSKQNFPSHFMILDESVRAQLITAATANVKG